MQSAGAFNPSVALRVFGGQSTEIDSTAKPMG
jgi:hypothetical protein